LRSNLDHTTPDFILGVVVTRNKVPRFQRAKQAHCCADTQACFARGFSQADRAMIGDYGKQR
jgi:hypothetical protein